MCFKLNKSQNFKKNQDFAIVHTNCQNVITDCKYQRFEFSSGFWQVLHRFLTAVDSLNQNFDVKIYRKNYQNFFRLDFFLNFYFIYEIQEILNSICFSNFDSCFKTRSWKSQHSLKFSISPIPQKNALPSHPFLFPSALSFSKNQNICVSDAHVMFFNGFVYENIFFFVFSLFKDLRSYFISVLSISVIG